MIKICSVDFCDRPSIVRGYCNTHYTQVITRGINPIPIKARKTKVKNPNAGKICSLEYCDKPASGRGYCSAHYAQVSSEPRPIRDGKKNKKCDATWCNRMMVEKSLCTPCYKRVTRYGLTVEKYISLNLVCEVCSSTENIHIDHCHTSGKYRGVLCSHCNTSLGFMMDSPDRIMALARYSERVNNV